MRAAEFLFWSKDSALGGGVARHRRNFFELEAGYKAWRGRAASPAVEFPMGTQEFDLGVKRHVKDHFCGASVELLREFQEREFAERLAVGRAPDGDVKGFLLDLLVDRKNTEKCA